MENLTAGNVEVQEIAENAIFHINTANPLEVGSALLLPAFALLLGIWLNRLLDHRENKTLHAKFFDFIGPLIGPGLAVLFLMAAGYTLRGLGYKLHVLPFVWKVAVAWTAIKLVVMMSSRQSAGWVIVLVIIPITLLHLFGLWDPVVNTLSDIKFSIGQADMTAWGVIKSIAAVIAMFWVAGFVVNATDSRLRRIRRIHVSNRMLIMKFFQIILYFIVFLIGLQVLGVDLTAFSVLGGAVGVGVGFGLQKIASNFMSGIILLFEKTVSIDDLIQLSDGTTGFIRQQAARYTMIEVADGRKIFIPNEEFITQRVTTLTHSTHRARVAVEVGVDYASDLQLVRSLLIKATKVNKAILTDPAPSAHVTGFGDSAINMLLWFWVENVVDGTFGPRTDVMIEIVRLFREHDISIPFPHQVQLHDAAVEQRLDVLEAHLHGKESPAKADKAAETLHTQEPAAKQKSVKKATETSKK